MRKHWRLDAHSRPRLESLYNIPTRPRPVSFYEFALSERLLCFSVDFTSDSL